MANRACLICLNFIDKEIHRPLSVYKKVFSTCKKHLHGSITDGTLTDDWDPATKHKQIPICQDCFTGSLELAKIVEDLENFQKQVNDLLLVFSVKILHRRSQVSSLEPLAEDINSAEVDFSKVSQHLNQTDSNSSQSTGTDEEQIKFFTTDEEQIKFSATDEEQIKFSATDEEQIKFSATDEEQIKFSPTSARFDVHYPMIAIDALKEEYTYEEGLCHEVAEGIIPDSQESENYLFCYPNDDTEDADSPEISVIDSTQIVQRNLNEEYFVSTEELSDNEERPANHKAELKVNLERLQFASDGKPIVGGRGERSKRKAFVGVAARMYKDVDTNLKTADFETVDDCFEESETFPRQAKNNGHPIPTTSSFNLKCKKVPLPKISSSNYQVNSKNLKINRNKKRRRKLDGNKLHECSVCGYRTLHHNYLTVHMRSHTGERPYKCHNCPKMFRQSAHLRVHLLTHSNIKHYKCPMPMCKKSFSNSSSLKGHIRRHSGEKRFLCSMCDYATSESGNLKRHVSTHTDSKPYKCAKCGMLYKSKIAVKKHFTTAHPTMKYSADCIIDP